MKKLKLPPSYFNYISYFGTIVALIAWIAIIFLFVISFAFDQRNVYSDLITFLITPMFLMLGFGIILFGMFLKRRRIKKGIVSDEKLLVINLKEPKTRNSILAFISIAVILLMFTIVGSYQGFHYTESTEFCGKLCHRVMDPEYQTYQNSPHANVKCSECHIGEGVDWYVKSKMSGMRQVFKYLFDTYPRPIETPIANLRPARETCEKCHWPQKFYPNRVHQHKYYLADSANTEWNVALNMKIGADHKSKGNSEGIHWHINPDISVDYVSDKKRENVYQVVLTDLKSGKKTIYTDSERKATADTLKKYETRRMDCMDCHNRPAHDFKSPSQFIGNLFASGKISSKIPYLNKILTETLNKKYKTKEIATKEIDRQVTEFYKKENPKIYTAYQKDIANALVQVKIEYFKNTFNEMNVSHSTYPRHIGHIENDGCFRCHNGTFKAPNGKVISKDCNLCHTFVGQGKKGNVTYVGFDKPSEFVHPDESIGEYWKETKCTECHKDMHSAK